MVSKFWRIFFFFLTFKNVKVVTHLKSKVYLNLTNTVVFCTTNMTIGYVRTFEDFCKMSYHNMIK